MEKIARTRAILFARARWCGSVAIRVPSWVIKDGRWRGMVVCDWLRYTLPSRSTRNKGKDGLQFERYRCLQLREISDVAVLEGKNFHRSQWLMPPMTARARPPGRKLPRYLEVPEIMEVGGDGWKLWKVLCTGTFTTSRGKMGSLGGQVSSARAKEKEDGKELDENVNRGRYSTHLPRHLD